MKISKEFRWEMGHRLVNHKGLCKNIHGHTYKMIIELEGETGKDGMIIDFYDLTAAVKPLIDKLDHCFLCTGKDKIVKEFLEKHNMKRVIVEYPSTVENICTDISDKVFAKLRRLKKYKFSYLTVRIFETPNSSAELTRKF